MSLDQPVGPDQSETLAATLGAEDGQFRRVENAVLAEDLLSELTPRERQVLRLRFEQDLTQAEIGERLGVSQMQVSRIIRQTIDHLHAVAEQHAALATAG